MQVEKCCFLMGRFDWLLKLRVDTLKPFLAKGLPMLTSPLASIIQDLDCSFVLGVSAP